MPTNAVPSAPVSPISSANYINSTVTENVTYPTPYAKDVAEDALQAARVYYDLFFENSPPQTAPEPPQHESVVSQRADLGSSHSASGSLGTLQRVKSQCVVNTAYHTFFPPVLLPAQRRRIIEKILGKPSRPFSSWNWKKAEDYEVILSAHDAFLKTVADREEGLLSLPNITPKPLPPPGVRPVSSKGTSTSALPRTASKPIPHEKVGGRRSSGAVHTPVSSARPSSSLPDAGKSKDDGNGGAMAQKTNNSFFYSFPASHQGPEYFSHRSEEGSTRLVIVMVGLPARGKTFLAQKICRLLGWHGERGTVFNLQAAWRQRIQSENPGRTPWVKADHFQRLIQDSQSAERQRYLEVLDEFSVNVRQFFEDSGKVVVLNDDFVSHDLRLEVEKRFKKLGTQYFYIEMMRDSSQNDLYNEFKVHDSFEYPEQVDRDVARKDFEKRVKILEETYEPLDEVFRRCQNSAAGFSSPHTKPSSQGTTPDNHRHESEECRDGSLMKQLPFSYITIRDSQTVEVHGIEGYLASRIISYLMNISQRKIQHPIYFVRHGQSCYNLEDRIGGNPLLTAQGMRDSAALLEFLDSLKTQLDAENPNKPAGEPAADAVSTSRMEVWTSQLQRAIQTAELSERLLNIKTLRWSSLNEIHAGVCEEMTYAEVREKYSLIDHFRKENKYTFRYPGGESYQDLVMRLEPVIMELENADKVVVVVAHQAILRCLLAYFGSVSAESSIRVKVPHRVVWRCQYNSKGVARLDEVHLVNKEAGSFAAAKQKSGKK